MWRLFNWKIVGLLSVLGVVCAGRAVRGDTTWTSPSSFQKEQFAWTREWEYRTPNLRMKMNDVFQLEQVEMDEKGWIHHVKGTINTMVECRMLNDDGKWKEIAGLPFGVSAGPAAACGKDLYEVAALHGEEELTPEQNFALAWSGEKWCDNWAAVVKKNSVKFGEEYKVICEERAGPLASNGSGMQSDGLDELAVNKILHPYDDCFWEDASDGSGDKTLKCE